MGVDQEDDPDLDLHHNSNPQPLSLMQQPYLTFFHMLERQTPRIETCLGRLDDGQIWRRPRPGMNSVGNLCLHLAGNEQHYIGHAIGCTDYRRERAHEFEAAGGYSAFELLRSLGEARATTARVLSSLRSDDLERVVESDYQAVPTIVALVGHVAQHYAYHTGQIVLLTKWLQTGEDRVLEWGH